MRDRRCQRGQRDRQQGDDEQDAAMKATKRHAESVGTDLTPGGRRRGLTVVTVPFICDAR
jgi:hypothetical protein